MRAILWLLVAMLIIAHQDFWYWEDTTFIMGFMPIGLFYHVCLSMAAAFVWFLGCTLAWPKGIDNFEDVELDSKSPSPEAGGKA